MSTLATLNPTIADVMARTMPDGSIERQICELNMQINEELLGEMTWIEGNLPTGHEHKIRTGYPTSSWGRFNKGVAQSKSQTQTVTDTCALLQQRSEIDTRLADLNGNKESWRFTEDTAHIIGLNEDLVSAVFYANVKTDPDKFHGLAPRFNDSTAANGAQIIKGGGSGSDNTSIWLVGWGTEGAFGIYPKGTSAGLKVEDKGKEKVFDGDSNPYYAYVTTYDWNVGLGVKDWGNIVRIPNIDVSDLTKNASSGADLVDLLIQAVEKLKNRNLVRPAFYCNATIRGFLRRQMQNKSNVYLSLDEIGGKKVMSFDGIPIRRIDGILNTEATVS